MKITVIVLSVLTLFAVLFVAGCDQLDALKADRDKNPTAVYRPIYTDEDTVPDGFERSLDNGKTWDGEVQSAAAFLDSVGQTDENIADIFTTVEGITGLAIFGTIAGFWRRKLLKQLIVANTNYESTRSTLEDVVIGVEAAKEELDEESAELLVANLKVNAHSATRKEVDDIILDIE